MKYKLYIITNFIVLAVGVLFILSGCKSKSTQLKAIEDSTSILQLTTCREVSRSSQDNDVVLGKPIYATLRIEYEPISNYSKEDVYDEIVAVLKNNKWEEEECEACSSGYFSANLHQGQVLLLSSVLIHSDENLVIMQIQARSSP